MAVYSELFKAVKSIIQNQSIALRNLLALVIIGAIEALVSSEKLFVCPTVGYATYGWSFIFGPAVIFLLISLLVREEFRQRVQGCCYGEQDICGRRCPCTKPRWGCNRKLIQNILQSLVIASMWVFMAFLQREYLACASLGSRAAMEMKELANVTEKSEQWNEIKLSIERKYNEVYDRSQYIGLIMVGVILGIAFITVTVYYCCCKTPYMSLPKPAKYEKLEAVAAVEAFKEKMKDYAEYQGRRHAEMFFSQNSQVNPSVLIKTYNELRGVDACYANAFPENNGPAIEAQAAKEAFDAKAKSAAKDQVETTYMAQESNNFNQQNAREQFISRYPIASGDLKNDFVSNNNNENDNNPGNTTSMELQPAQSPPQPVQA